MSITLHTEIVNDLLKLAVESGASDIVIKSEKPGYLRIAGRWRDHRRYTMLSEDWQASRRPRAPRGARSRP